MDPLTPVVMGALLALFTAIQTWINKGRFDALDKRIDGVADELRNLRSELKDDIRELRAEVKADINAVRSDLTIVALAVGAQPRPQAG